MQGIGCGLQPRHLVERVLSARRFYGFAIRQQELAKAAAIGVKWQDILLGCGEVAE
jgi:hypothetical protein